MPEGVLSGFEELLAIDASVLRLHDLLSPTFAACRTNHTKAAAKLHVVMNVLDGSPRKVKLTSERTGNGTPWKRVGQWVRGRLMLFDLGYYSFHLFDRIGSAPATQEPLGCTVNPWIRIVSVKASQRVGQAFSVNGKRIVVLTQGQDDRPAS